MKDIARKFAVPLIALTAFAGGVGTMIASAASAASAAEGSSVTKAPAHTPRGVAGTVTAVSGTTITLTGKDGTTYTVNAGTATVEKIETINASAIAVGDTLMVGGTSVTAEHIMDGKMPEGKPFEGPLGGRMGPHSMGGAPAASATTPVSN